MWSKEYALLKSFPGRHPYLSNRNSEILREQAFSGKMVQKAMFGADTAILQAAHDVQYIPIHRLSTTLSGPALISPIHTSNRAHPVVSNCTLFAFLGKPTLHLLVQGKNELSLFPRSVKVSVYR